VLQKPSYVQSMLLPAILPNQAESDIVSRETGSWNLRQNPCDRSSVFAVNSFSSFSFSFD